jgi:tRNA G10  N-methylase Trm11
MPTQQTAPWRRSKLYSMPRHPLGKRKICGQWPLAFRVAVFQSLVLARLPGNSRVLDLGCGTGAIVSALSACGFRMTACDIAEETIEGWQRNLRTFERRMAGSDVRLEASSVFPGVSTQSLRQSLLEYLPNVEAVLAECRRTLASGGIQSRRYRTCER